MIFITGNFYIWWISTFYRPLFYFFLFYAGFDHRIFFQSSWHLTFRCLSTATPSPRTQSVYSEYCIDSVTTILCFFRILLLLILHLKISHRKHSTKISHWKFPTKNVLLKLSHQKYHTTTFSNINFRQKILLNCPTLVILVTLFHKRAFFFTISNILLALLYKFNRCSFFTNKLLQFMFIFTNMWSSRGEEIEGGLCQI